MHDAMSCIGTTTVSHFLRDIAPFNENIVATFANDTAIAAIIHNNQ